MADTQRSGFIERDIDQAFTTLKKGSYLLKYGRRGKPKFCPFQLSHDERMLIWYSGKEEKHLKLNQVSRIIPGQRTAIFQRYPRPEKEYQSFSLIYNDRSLDLICKDKDEAEIWFVGLKALITRGNYYRKWKVETRSESVSSESPNIRAQKTSPLVILLEPEQRDGLTIQVPFESVSQNRLGKTFSHLISHATISKPPNQTESPENSVSLLTADNVDQSNGRNSTSEAVRVSFSSAVSSSSQGSCRDDFDALGDVFIWGEGVGNGLLGGHNCEKVNSSNDKVDALLPIPLESTVVLDTHNIACSGRHAVIVTKQGEIFSWGEECGGRLGHGTEVNFFQPKLIDSLSGISIDSVACGEYHTCAVTASGDLYTWGGGAHNFGLLGHGSEASHWIPRKVSGDMEGIHISHISCGLCHTAVVTSTGQLFTFGDGTFGVLGHGDHGSTSVPREVESLKGLRATKVACGVWHTAAVIEVTAESCGPGVSDGCSFGKLFTWGDGDKGRLGHGDKQARLVPECVAALDNEDVRQVDCGYDLTVALTRTGRVYTMGSSAYGQLGSPLANEKFPTLVEGKIAEILVEKIACGSYHVAVLTSKTDVFTWGKGSNGQLGHGDNEGRSTPTLVESLKDKQVKMVVCGSNFTAIICPHKWVHGANHSACMGCRNLFGFRRKRHNCYNCGLVFCKVCSSRKSIKASLAPDMNKPYRVCDDCFNKLNKNIESGFGLKIPKAKSENVEGKTNNAFEKETVGPRLQMQVSILSSGNSSLHAESWHSKNSKTPIYNSRVFPIQNGNFQFGGFGSSSIPTFLDEYEKKALQYSTPSSRMASQTSFPFLRISPDWSSETKLDDLKCVNASLCEEIASLRAQVHTLTSRYQHLEAELDRKSGDLKGATLRATVDAEKSKSTKLKDKAKKLPEVLGTNRRSCSVAKRTSSMQKLSGTESQLSSVLSHEFDSQITDHQLLSVEAKIHTEKAQWVVQVEAGVYITLSPLIGNAGNELKRIRFSRKHFTEQKAEKWWAENGSRVYKRYKIRSTD